MHYVTLVITPIMLVASILAGAGLVVLVGLLGIIRAIFADSHHHEQPLLSDSDMQLSDSIARQMRV